MLSLIDLALAELAAMATLVVCSAFFSSSEAALFYLSRQDRRALASGGRAQRAAAHLLEDPDRLLSAVLFWNVMVNIAYFALASIVGIKLQDHRRPAEAGAFVLGSLFVLIFFSEMLPKSMAVLRPRVLAALVGVPLSGTVRLLDPLMPSLRAVNLLSRRLLWPRFRPEPYLEVADLERAVRLSTSDAALLAQEETVLQNILSLSQLRVDELMRPRTQLLTFHPPVSRKDLRGQVPPSGYAFITEQDSDEVAAAIPLTRLAEVPEVHLEHYADDVLYVPWSATAAAALDAMRRRDGRVVAVVNELGETIGILTFDDILESIFVEDPSRTARLLKRSPLRQVRPGVWQVAGMTNIRRLARELGIELPRKKSVTVTGVIQELLERLPESGDRCRWGRLNFEVLNVSQEGQLLVELTLTDGDESGT